MVQLPPMLVVSAFEPFDPRATRLVGVSMSSSGSALSEGCHRSLSRICSRLRCHHVEPAFSAKLRRLATAVPLLAPDQHLLGRLIAFDVPSNSNVLTGCLAKTVLVAASRQYTIGMCWDSSAEASRKRRRGKSHIVANRRNVYVPFGHHVQCLKVDRPQCNKNFALVSLAKMALGLGLLATGIKLVLS